MGDDSLSETTNLPALPDDPGQFILLDVIISVGYRVKSHRGTQFRIWAPQHLREYLIKGFALGDQRLKQSGGGHYFDKEELETLNLSVVTLCLPALHGSAIILRREMPPDEAAMDWLEPYWDQTDMVEAEMSRMSAKVREPMEKKTE